METGVEAITLVSDNDNTGCDIGLYSRYWSN